MKWIFTPILLISFVASAQDFNFGEIAQESSESLDEFGYYNPVFEWNMEGRIQAALNEGINSLNEGSPNVALPHLDEAIKLSPKLWVAHYYRGVCLKQLGQFAAAEKAFLLVNELNDKNLFNYIELGKTSDLLKDYKQGEKWFERAAKIDPANATPVYMLANHFLKRGLVDRAKRLYKDCLETDPKMLDAEVKLAIIDAAQRKNSKQALKYLNDILAKDSLHKQAFIFHGLLTIEDRHTTLKDWNKLVRLTPGNSTFRFIRGMLLTDEGDYEQAFSDLRKVVEAADINSNKFIGMQTSIDKRIDIEFAGHYVVANVYGFPDEDAFQLKKAYCLLFPARFDDALQAIRKVKGSATSPLCLFLKGVANEHKGKHVEAYYAYDSALRYDNDIIDAHKKRGIYLLELKNHEFAEADFSEILKINSEAYVAYRFRGLARFNLAKYKSSLEDYTKFLQRDSTNNDIRAERAMVYQKMQDYLPSTLDLLKSKRYDAIEPFTVIEKDINKLLAKNDTTKALWWLNEFSKWTPSFYAARKLEIDLLMSQRKWKTVESRVDSSLLTFNENFGPLFSPEQRSFFLTCKGICLTNQDNHSGAIKQFDAAVILDKNNAKAFLERAEVHLKMNDKKSARADLHKARSLGNVKADKLLKSIAW